MEVVTILGNQDKSEKLGYSENYGCDDICKHRSKRDLIAPNVLYGLLFLSLVSQLFLHFEVKQLKKDLMTIKTTSNDNYNADTMETICNCSNIDSTNQINKNGEQVHSRTQRTTDSINPHFELEGSGTSIDGVFTWNGTVGAGFSAVVQRGYIKGVQILNTGTYRIQAKVAINGRNKGNSRPRPSEPLIAPAVGIYLMKERRRIPEVLDRTWKTQDERGVIRYTSRHHEREPTSTASKLYPLDTIEVSGGYFLEVNDVIYLQRPGDSLYDPNFERFLNDKDHARFVVHKYA